MPTASPVSELDAAVDLLRRVAGAAVSTDAILAAVEEMSGFSQEQLRSPARTQPLADARHLAMHTVRRLTGLSYPEIGRVFGQRHHTTVLHAVRKVDALLSESPDAAATAERLQLHIQTGPRTVPQLAGMTLRPASRSETISSQRLAGHPAGDGYPVGGWVACCCCDCGTARAQIRVVDPGPQTQLLVAFTADGAACGGCRAVTASIARLLTSAPADTSGPAASTRPPSAAAHRTRTTARHCRAPIPG